MQCKPKKNIIRFIFIFHFYFLPPRYTYAPLYPPRMSWIHAVVMLLLLPLRVLMFLGALMFLGLVMLFLDLVLLLMPPNQEDVRKHQQQ